MPVGDRTLGAAGGYGEGAADLSHLWLAEGADVAVEQPLLHSLHMVEVDGGVVLQAFVRADYHFAWDTPDGRGYGRHHSGAQQWEHLLAGEEEDGAALVRRGEAVLPYLSAPGLVVHGSGHTPSSAHPWSSSSAAAPP